MNLYRSPRYHDCAHSTGCAGGVDRVPRQQQQRDARRPRRAGWRRAGRRAWSRSSPRPRPAGCRTRCAASRTATRAAQAACRSPGKRRAGRCEVSIDIGSPSASRSRWIRSSRPPGRTPSSVAELLVGGDVADVEDLGLRVEAVLPHPLGVAGELERLGDLRLGDERALALHAQQAPLDDQLGQGLPDGGPGGAVEPGELAFRRHRAAGRHGRREVEQMLLDLVVLGQPEQGRRGGEAPQRARGRHRCLRPASGTRSWVLPPPLLRYSGHDDSVLALRPVQVTSR